MLKRAFVQPTSEEIKERKKMYREAALLGIDLMEYDESRQSSMERRDRREAVVLLGTDRTLSTSFFGFFKFIVHNPCLQHPSDKADNIGVFDP